MTDFDRPAFAEAMHALGETFNEPVSDTRAEAYFDALSEFSMEQVNRGVRLALRSCRYFPRPVEVRELIAGPVGEHADRAWGEVLEQIRRVGYMGTPTFSDTRISETVRQVWGGWRRLCETLPAEGPELVGWVKQFKAVFGTVSTREAIASPTLKNLPEELRGKLLEMANQKVLR